MLNTTNTVLMVIFQVKYLMSRLPPGSFSSSLLKNEFGRYERRLCRMDVKALSGMLH